MPGEDHQDRTEQDSDMIETFKQMRLQTETPLWMYVASALTLLFVVAWVIFHAV